MILIADSGSSKTNWIIIKNNDTIQKFNTKGFNPYFINSSNDITEELLNHFPNDINKEDITHIYFYGAGCSSEEMNSIISNPLKTLFPNSVTNINSDLIAAARALFFKEKGIAVILGTGSSCCYYNGEDIAQNTISLGYILGNEGGGDYLGKILITDFLNDELPFEIRNKLTTKYNLSKKDILYTIYKKPYPNRFLASFCPFISKNIKTEYSKAIIKKSFTDLFNKHICKYKNYNKSSIRFTGSIAYYFKNQLKEVALNFNTDIDKIIKSPIENLAEYHIKYK